jgi:Phage tail assembly chaperone
MVMFRFNPAPEFFADVRVTVPGSADPATLRLKFRHLGREALSAWIAKPSKQSVVNDAEYLGEVVTGWEAVKDDQDRDVPFGQAALASLLDAYPAAGREIFAAYVSALTESRAKN